MLRELQAAVRENRRAAQAEHDHARQAIDWATGDRDLVERNIGLFLAALR